MDTLAFIESNKIITICRKVYGQDLENLAGALVPGNVKLIEVTFVQQDPDCIKNTTKAISTLCEKYGDSMMFGAGTVLTKEQVKAAADAGARYIISPNTDAEVITYTKELGLVSIPGAMTPSEIMNAHNLGADIVKLFPAGYLGFGYIKDILAPISHVKLCATGGVNEDNWGKYLEFGFVGAGISSRLCDKKCIAAGDFAEITRRAQAFVDITKAHA